VAPVTAALKAVRVTHGVTRFGFLALLGFLVLRDVYNLRAISAVRKSKSHPRAPYNVRWVRILRFPCPILHQL